MTYGVDDTVAIDASSELGERQFLLDSAGVAVLPDAIGIECDDGHWSRDGSVTAVPPCVCGGGEGLIGVEAESVARRGPHQDLSSCQLLLMLLGVIVIELGVDGNRARKVAPPPMAMVRVAL